MLDRIYLPVLYQTFPPTVMKRQFFLHSNNNFTLYEKTMIQRIPTVYHDTMMRLLPLPKKK